MDGEIAKLIFASLCYKALTLIHVSNLQSLSTKFLPH